MLLNMFCSDIVNHMDYWKVKRVLATEQETCEALSEYHHLLNYEAKASTSFVVELSGIQLPEGGKRVVVSCDAEM